jgi:hypothetical protein
MFHTHAPRAHTRVFGFTRNSTYQFMAKIEKNKIDKILDCTHIEDVIEKCLGTYGRNNPNGLRKKGIRYEALCPFHDDKTMGSFKVYPAGNCYKCFSCGEKGGAVDFLMKHEGMSYPDAIRWLGKLYNIDVDDATVNWTFTPRPAPPQRPPSSRLAAAVAARLQPPHRRQCLLRLARLDSMYSVARENN